MLPDRDSATSSEIERDEDGILSDGQKSSQNGVGEEVQGEVEQSLDGEEEVKESKIEHH